MERTRSEKDHQQQLTPQHLKIKLKRSQGCDTKLTRIDEKPPKPDPITTDQAQNRQLVLYQRSRGSRRRKRVAAIDLYENAEAKSSPMRRAEEIQAKLGAECPSFAKPLVRSNVTTGFWMHLPMKFCKSYLPKGDTPVFLENERGEEFLVNYIAERTALSGGWKAFCSGNNLIEGDVLIFHLIKPLWFKVYVERGNKPAEVNREFGVEDSVIHDEQQMCTEINAGKEEGGEVHEKGDEVENGYHIENLGSQGSNLPFKDTTSIENFTINVNGLPIDSELSDEQRTKYYELCCSQNSYLHNNLLESINHKLAAEIIIGTVNISEAIRASKLSNAHSDYAVWDKTLTGFELLGMNVGFLRAQLNRLISLAKESKRAVEAERKELRGKQEHIKYEIGGIETRILQLKMEQKRLDNVIKDLQVIAERHEIMFKDMVNAPW